MRQQLKDEKSKESDQMYLEAKPFIKWVGGKGQLLQQLDDHLPATFREWQEVTYIEPFIGGGAMLFYMLSHYPNIQRAVINDINPDLVTAYRTIKERPEELIASLQVLQDRYYALESEEQRKAFYLESREVYNQKQLDPIENTTLFIFLNRTCFNGLYRVNKSGGFNVPFGKYDRPTICDAPTITADSALLQKVDILYGDFAETLRHARGNTLFYFDPPYRPLSSTSSFNEYAKQSFNDDSQRRLKLFCDQIHEAGHAFMLSNSDGRGAHSEDTFMDTLYQDYIITRVAASRSINANPSKRGKITEILVRNYRETQSDALLQGSFFSELELCDS